MKNRRQALWFFLNTAIVVVVRVSNQLGFEVFERIEFMQVQRRAFQQAKDMNPMETMHAALSRFQDDRSYRIPGQSRVISDDFLHLFDHFNAMAAEVQQSHEKDVKLLETEMDNLRLQVNPHMLLNSYNTIYALAESKNYPVIQDYTLCLVDYFRYVLRRGQQLVTVGQELGFVDNFIRIQRIRFPGRFSYVYQAEEECMNAQIPPLLIENFVENAVKYALEPQEAIEIVVSVRKDQNRSGKDALPKDKAYKAELIDVWNMTREVIAENISGETRLKLPGRDNLVLLITRIQ